MRQVEGRDHNTEKRGKTSPRRCPRCTTTPVALTAAGRTDPHFLGLMSRRQTCPSQERGGVARRGQGQITGVKSQP